MTTYRENPDGTRTWYISGDAFFAAEMLEGDDAPDLTREEFDELVDEIGESDGDRASTTPDREFLERDFTDPAPLPTALLSPDRRYRYLLVRRVARNDRIALFVMVNPSTADEREDDATIRRCMGYARSWGYGWLYVCNLSPYRATDPRDLVATGAEPAEVWDYNLALLKTAAAAAEIVIVAWGANGRHENRAERVLEALAQSGAEINCLATTKGGYPVHPLRQPRYLLPTRYAVGN